MTIELQKKRSRLVWLLGGLALSTLPVGCGSADEPFNDAAATNDDTNDENVAEASQGLTQTLTFRQGNPGSSVIDTYLDSGKPTAVNGSQGGVFVGKDAKSTEITLINWNISSIPLGSTVSSAQLTIASTYTVGVAPQVRRVARSWSDGSANWNSMSTGFDSAVVTSFPALYAFSTTPSFWTVNVTSLVQDWVSGKYANYGLALVPSANETKYGIFFSSDSSYADRRPTLRVTYTTPFCAGQPDGIPCNDNNACTQTDVCQSNTCVGSNPKVCPSAITCQANACNPATGMCAAGPLPNGTACDDGNLCTQTSSCQSGACIGANPIVCQPIDGCHLSGVCLAATGTCSTGATIVADTQTGMLHRWTFDESSGLALDSSGATPGSFWPGQLGNSATRTPSFDGSNALFLNPTSPTDYQSYVRFMTNEGLASNYTVTTWFKAPMPTASGDMISTSSDTALIVKLANTGKTRVWLANKTLVDTSGVIADNTWHHLAFVRNASGLTQYVDGVQSFNSPFSTPPDHSIGLRLGYGGVQSVGAVKESFDDFRIYTRAIAPCDALTLANKVIPTPPPGVPGTTNLGECSPLPVGWWKGDDSLVDSAGTNNGASGIQNGATPVTFAAGRIANGFALNGQSYVQIPNAPNLQITGNISLSAWVYINTAGGRIFDKVTAGGSNGYLLDTNQGKLRLYVGNTAVISSPSLLPTSQWIHVAGTWNGVTGKLYVNGALVHSYNPPNPQPIPISTQPLRIGSDSNGQNRLNGMIDEAAVFATTLTDSQIEAIAKTSPSAAPIGWWRGDGSFADVVGVSPGGSGTLAGAIPVTFAPGKISSAFVLNGQSFVEIPNTPNLQVTGSISLSAWIYMKSSGGRILDKVTANTSNGYLLDTNQGKLRMIAGGNPLFQSSSLIPLNQWSHIAGTWDGMTAKLYIDGALVLDQSPPSPVQIPSNTLPLRIGGDSNGQNRFDGLIDEPAIHDVAITQAQIDAMVNSGALANLATTCMGTFTQPAPSCAAILAANPNAPSGSYTITSGGTTFQMTCP